MKSEVSRELEELLKANPGVKIFGIRQKGKCVGLDSASDNDKQSMIKQINLMLDELKYGCIPDENLGVHHPV